MDSKRKKGDQGNLYYFGLMSFPRIQQQIRYSQFSEVWLARSAKESIVILELKILEQITPEYRIEVEKTSIQLFYVRGVGNGAAGG
jgi:hypothetical protein